MKLDDLKNRTILLFGKPRAFNAEEFGYQLRQCGVKSAAEYDSGVSYIVEGRLVTPYEQNELDRLYEEGLKEKFVDIDELEKTLIKNIDADALLMSLKLSHDRERVLAYIKNSAIDDTLFLRLITLYDWQNEGFFDNDDNRDVTAALISRFYKNIERNHNVQYATLGLMHLIEQSDDEKLIEAISNLSPIKKGFSDSALYPVILSIAKNRATPNPVLKMLLKHGDLQIKKSIASKAKLDKTVQNMLFSLKEDEVTQALCENENLDVTLTKLLLEDYSDTIAQNINLDEELFELFLQRSAKYLAKNRSLTKEMQARVLSLNDNEVSGSLAANPSLDEKIASEILLLGDDEINLSLFANLAVSEENLREAYLDEKNHLSLASNPKTPVDILKKLAEDEDIEVIKALCKNPSTPVELLYEFRLDQRLERLVSENKAFTNYIKTENIGWKD